MRLSELKETTSHGLRWNNSPVSPAVLFFLLVFFFAEFCFLICMLACDKRLIKFSGKTHVQHNSKSNEIRWVENLKIIICLCILYTSYTLLVCLDIFAYFRFLDLA